ncbi:murein biosynthesis integral membrane protein MurJ [Caballeronia zhejiangensis]|uniref:murein biosynthesis integral membrane protein MurJ n=1 Tax=Caballeronia zhejiangensis TaxID=871203 RepID=UPI001FD52941|nr:lipid II flippase MurJ [Caballeronia zhejiangensis]
MLVAHINRFRSRLSNIHPVHKRIAKSAARISLFVIVGKCAGAFKEMSIAYRYGISDVVDAYQLTFTLSTFLPSIFIGCMSIVLIPTLVALRTATKAKQAKFVSEVEVASVSLGILMALILYLLWDPLLNMIAADLSEQTRAISRQLEFGMLPVGALLLTICVSAARLQARERHVNTLLECVPSATVLASVLFAHNSQSPAPLMWGTVIGFILQATLLRVLALRADSIRVTPRFSLTSPEWPYIYRSVGVVLFGGIVVGLATPLDQYYLAHLGDGAIATAAYANRLLALLLGIGALAIGRATLPILSEVLSTGDMVRARDTAVKWSFLMLGSGAVTMAVPWLLAPWGVALLFEHGAFTSQDTMAVSTLLRWGLVQVPFYLAGLVLLQLFAGQRRFHEIAVVAVISFALKALANFWLVRWFGVVGVLLATAVMNAGALGCYFLLFVVRYNHMATDHADESSRMEDVVRKR